jgi:hypothetical protein
VGLGSADVVPGLVQGEGLRWCRAVVLVPVGTKNIECITEQPQSFLAHLLKRRRAHHDAPTHLWCPA